MTRRYPEFKQALATRQRTLEAVESLSQKQSDFRPAPGKWSVGEVLDHLLRTDALIVRELEVVFRRRRLGLPFVYRGLADVDTTLPAALRPVLPFFEVPFGFANALVPPPVRRFLTGNRRLPVQAPAVLRPRTGRPIDDLRRELASTFVTLRRQQDEHPGVDLDRVFYYNPIVGLGSVPGIYRFVANHERRHQLQIREVLDGTAFPMAA